MRETAAARSAADMLETQHGLQGYVLPLQPVVNRIHTYYNSTREQISITMSQFPVRSGWEQNDWRSYIKSRAKKNALITNELQK